MDSAKGGGEGTAGESKGARCPTVLFKDDNPKEGFVTLILTIPHMTVKRSVCPKLQPSNGIVNVKFDTGSIEVTVTLNDEQFSYLYKRSLPADILDRRSTYRVKKEAVVLSLAKTKADQSWASHSQHFIRKTNSVSTAAD